MYLRIFVVYFILFCLFLPVSGQSKRQNEDELRIELAGCLEKAGSSYYAYPGPLQKQYSPVPRGYQPVYLSHYGRHGSRLLTEDSRYLEILNIFDSNDMTEFGKDVRKRLEIVWQDAKGCGGDLTRVGELQHYSIAQRMAHNFPTLFEGKASIRVVSSTSRRCMMSMMSFCEGLKEMYPVLQITRSAHERDMAYINYESKELKQFASKTGDWWTKVFEPFTHELVNPNRLAKSLFSNKLDSSISYKLFDGLYWIASDMQNVELGDLTFYDLFTPEELYSYWRCQNLKMYTTNGPSEANGGVTAESSKNLLNQMIKEADESLAGGQYSANLRFGHDSALIRLLVLMHVNEVSATSSDAEVAKVWQDFRITPMAANLQIVFYKNASGDVLVKLLLNENEVSVPLPSRDGCYYSWTELKDFWQRQL